MPVYMSDHWHLTPQSEDVKGNNPYQLNRMTVDPSFRAPTIGYDLASIQGYSATGDIVLKGERLALAPPKEKSCLESLKKPSHGEVTPANQGSTIAKYTECSQKGAGIEPFRHGRRHGKKHHRRLQQIQEIQQQLQFRDQLQQQAHLDNKQSGQISIDAHAHPETGVVADWQQAFGTKLTQSHLDQLNSLTEARYNSIMKEPSSLARY